MISVLRNNTKVLTQQERSLTNKFQRSKQEELSNSQLLPNDMRFGQSIQSKNEEAKLSDSGSKGRSFNYSRI
jgi:hypothetical protein